MTTAEIQMPSTRPHAHIYYATMADRMDRDPVQVPGVNGRATVPMGRGFGLWQRMNPGVQLVSVLDMEGRERYLTPTQAEVAGLAMSMVEGDMLTMRGMAVALGVSPSTVSRALAKLSAWGIIAYIVGRGRYAGLVIIKRVKDDGLDRFRDAARARVKRWSEAARRRFSRLAVNVAPYILGGEDALYALATSSTTSNYYMSATLTLQRSWTAAEVADIV
jgi:hypothetical protein